MAAAEPVVELKSDLCIYVEQPCAHKEDPAHERWWIHYNVTVISIAFLLLFCAFESMSKLQSSINSVDNLGTWSNACIYASLILSSMFLPSWIIKRLQPKWTIVLSMICYSTYIAAQFDPQFYTLLPTGILLGAGAAPLWSAKCVFLTHLAKRLAHLDGVTPDIVLSKFFGIFFFFFQCNSIIGNGIGMAVLTAAPMDIKTDRERAMCGSAYCPDPSIAGGSTSADKNDQVSLLVGVYLVLSIAAVLIVVFLAHPLARFGKWAGREDTKDLPSTSLLVATFSHMKQPTQLLIIPLTLWSGLEQGFFGNDFTAGLVKCAYGVEALPLVLICYGVVDASTCVLTGHLVKIMPRVAIFLLAAVANAVVILTLSAYTPTAANKWVIYVLAGLWGFGDAVWQAQINAFYGVLFTNNEEAAFANYRLWESLGFLMAFVSGAMYGGMCLLPKLVFISVILVCGLGGAVVVEIWEQQKAKLKGAAAREMQEKIEVV
eukprot:GEMP01021748.1.p1 GENE.GEMP01021748.1~~GEMP01021748.1.p1  ORF type:complete len:488 (+),score=105.76 GEMP01021748.1:182-1645(+)